MFKNLTCRTLAPEGLAGIKSITPRCSKIYENCMKNNIIRKYLNELKELEMPATALGIFY